MKLDINQANLLIRNRRSIYPNMYSGEVVSKDAITNMLENANWAPTHRLTEPWRFVVFSGTGLKKLAEFQSELYARKTRSDGSYDEKIFQKLGSKPLSASHIIAIGMKRDPKNSVPEIEEVAAVSCSVQNMYLTAAAYGVGCYWSTGGVIYFEEAKKFFGLGAEDKLLGFLYLGMPKSRWPTGRRSSIEDKVTWVID